MKLNEYAGLLVLHSLLLLNYRRNMASLSLFCRYYFGRCSSEPGVLLVILKDCMIFVSPLLDETAMSISKVSFLAQLDPGIILCLENAFF